MGTKILFIDDDGDIIMDHAYCAYVCYPDDTPCHKGVQISITDNCGIFIQTMDPEQIIRQLFEHNQLDLTEYGPVVWIDSDGNWSNEDNDGKDESSMYDEGYKSVVEKFNV